MIRNDSPWPQRMVQLYVCYTGRDGGQGSYAQELANELGAPVSAPTGGITTGISNGDGSFRTELDSDSKFVTFRPQ